MSADAVRVFTSGGIRALDAQLDSLDLLELTMELAGEAVARELHARYAAADLLILAGGGANGGDALAAARHLHARGRRLRVLALESRHALARRMRARLEPFVAVEALSAPSLRAALATPVVVLDGLLGTGFRPPLRGELAEVIRELNRADRPVVCIDVPSGLPPDTAVYEGEIVRSQLILALAGLKPALLFQELPQTVVLNPGIAPELLERHALARVTAEDELRGALPRRPRGAHKGNAGRVFVLGGSPGFTGAPVMTAMGALRAGAGLVSLYSRAALPQHPVEAMAHRVQDWTSLEALGRPDAVAVGMGLGEDAVEVARRVLAWGVPCVVDADALRPELRGCGHAGVVWTPHPGEAARLLGVATGEIVRDPLASAGALQEAYGGTVVLKGGPSVIAGAGELRVCTHGNPGMATGGSGDVLAGVIAALLGQGLPANVAAWAGVELHARAGDRSARSWGYGLIASDLPGAVAAEWRALTKST